MNKFAPLDEFSKLQQIVSENLSKKCQKIKDKSRSSIFFRKTFLKILDFLCTFIFYSLLFSGIWVQKLKFLESYIDKDFFSDFIFLIQFILSAGLIFLPAFIFYPRNYLIKRFPKYEMYLINFQSLAITPSFVFFILFILGNLTKVLLDYNLSKFEAYLGFMLLIYGLTFFLSKIICFCYLIIPNHLILFLANPIKSKSNSNHISSDYIAKYVFHKSYYYIKNLSEYVIKQLNDINKQKLTSLTSQVQTIAPLLSVTSLFSLFALIFSQDKIKEKLNYVDNFLQFFSINSVKNITEFLIISLILFLIYISYLYFFRAYWALKVLELIDLMLTLKLAELTNQREVSEANNKVLNEQKSCFWRRNQI